MLSIPKLPEPSVYELEYNYWPWGKLLSSLVERIKFGLPKGSKVCDYMCGTGFLLNSVSQARPDLHLVGCSLDASYIAYGKRKYPQINIEFADALKWKPLTPQDTIICTAGLHHLDRASQPRFISKVASELSQGAFFFLGEELITAYNTEEERRAAVNALFSRLIRHLTDIKAPDNVVQAAFDVFDNDLSERGEYKISYGEMTRLLGTHFSIESVEHFWPPDDSLMGDFLFVCRKL